MSVAFLSCRNNTTSYFDQAPPSQTPKLFAPAIVNTDSIELNVVFNATHTEMFFSRIVDNSFVIHHSELINSKWSDVKPLQMYPDSISISVACDPTITKDGNTMYFLGVDPKLYNNDTSPEKLFAIPPDIYMSKKVNGEWGLAKKVEFDISTEYLESYPVVVADGSLYFHSSRPSEKGGRNTYRAQYLGNEKFSTPTIVNVNTEGHELISYVSPDERYAITNGEGKFQITFNSNGEWSAPEEVALDYDKDWRYYCPYMSSDEKYFIFSRRYNNPSKKGWAGVEKGEVYWVNADILFNTK
ncbi:hypothetical protein JMN32_18345 [Fulvivirga sp. 29W222]|uniref:WD40 repeat protein n=1 Tax=Fulvivirga marina TaxID=2494733 RepID=A0A937G164_9BACT|nr:hypothetical protein [Fulvivirga marina]MBL6448281.1 hypothetical protein [Fulvivirga marina]